MGYKRVKSPKAIAKAKAKAKARALQPQVAGKALIKLTLAYFVIELIVNTSVYGQLSGSSDMLMAEVMEFWGKIIAGLGMGLLITRYQLAKRLKQNHINTNAHIYKTFLRACLVAIPLSFILQESLIYYVTNQASDEDRNKAILVSATHNTMVPFYVPPHPGDWHDLNPLDMLIYPASRFMTDQSYRYWRSKGNEIKSSAVCSEASIDTLGITSDTDKVFFQYKAMLAGFDEAFYKQVIKDYYICAFEDKNYFINRTSGNLNQKRMLDETYDKLYNPAVDEYIKHKDYSFGRKKAKKLADERWREYMDEIYGFKTTIKPIAMYHEIEGFRQGRYYFYDHPDTRRYYAEKTGITDIYPVDDNFREMARQKIKENLPGRVIPAYISTTGERSEVSKELTDEEISEQGKTAYKAIVMPMIALGLSGFFLILNIILVINTSIQNFIIKERSILSDKKDAKRIAKYYAEGDRRHAERAEEYRQLMGEVPLKPKSKYKAIFLRCKSIPTKLNILEIPLLNNKQSQKLSEYLCKTHLGRTKHDRVMQFIDKPIIQALDFLSFRAFFVTAIVWLLFWPSIQQGEEYNVFEGAKFEQTSKWLYYHESNLILVYDTSYKVIRYALRGGWAEDKPLEQLPSNNR